MARHAVRVIMLGEAASFAVASLIHSGRLIQGYEHRQARIAEGVIATVLLIGVVVSVIRPAWLRVVGLGAQGFALLGTFVGVFTIAIGVGPRTLPDVFYHIGIVVVLAWGLVLAKRVGLEGDSTDKI